MRHSPTQRQSPPCPPPYTPPPPPPPPPPPLTGCAPIDEAPIDEAPIDEALMDGPPPLAGGAPARAVFGGPRRPPLLLKELGAMKLLLATAAAPLPPFPSPTAAPRTGASEGTEREGEGAVSVGVNQAPS